MTTFAGIGQWTTKSLVGDGLPDMPDETVNLSIAQTCRRRRGYTFDLVGMPQRCRNLDGTNKVSARLSSITAD